MCHLLFGRQQILEDGNLKPHALDAEWCHEKSLQESVITLKKDMKLGNIEEGSSVLQSEIFFYAPLEALLTCFSACQRLRCSSG